jgi:hypothetical protein
LTWLSFLICLGAVLVCMKLSTRGSCMYALPSSANLIPGFFFLFQRHFRRMSAVA